jgi:ankyrin repeat protein
MSELLQALYRGDRKRVDELLVEEPALNVFEAAAFGRTERVRDLLDDDPSLANAFADDGFQPLGLACFFGHVKTAQLLLERNADPNTLAKNEQIQTSALHAAAASENKDPDTRYELCKMLLAHGADPNLRQGSGGRAIDAARMTGHAELEQLLVRHGATG